MTSDQGQRRKFYDWMVNVRGMSENTARAYCVGLKKCAAFLSENDLTQYELYDANYDEAVETGRYLLSNRQFQILNEQEHRSPVAGLKKYVEYLADRDSTIKGKRDLSLSVANESNNVVLDKNSTYIIDLGDLGKVTFTEPVSMHFAGRDYGVSSWTDLYVRFCKCLYSICPSAFTYHSNAAFVADGENDSHRLARPVYIGGGFYVETHSSSKDKAIRMVKLLEYSTFGPHDVVIACRKKVSDGDITLRKNTDISVPVRNRPESEQQEKTDENISEDESRFKSWMINTKNLAEVTASNYVRYVYRIEKLMQSESIQPGKLYGSTYSEALVISEKLRNNRQFCDSNERWHNSLTAALNSYIKYLNFKENSADGQSRFTSDSADEARSNSSFAQNNTRGSAGNTSNATNSQDAFADWLKGKLSAAQLSEVFASYYDISAVLMEKRVIELPILSITDESTIASALKYMQTNYMFHHNHYGEYSKWCRAVQLYLEWLQNGAVSSSASNNINKATSGNMKTREQSTSGTHTPDEEGEHAFKNWLMYKKHYSGDTAENYARGVRRCAKILGKDEYALFGANAFDAGLAIDRIRHRNHSDQVWYGMQRLLEWTGENCKIINEQPENTPDKTAISVPTATQFQQSEPSGTTRQPRWGEEDVESKSNDVVIDPELIRNCHNILHKEFPNGFKLQSIISMSRFINRYNETNGTEIDKSDIGKVEQIRQAIIAAGINVDGCVYAPESILDDQSKDKLATFISSSVKKGATRIYYRAIFDQLRDVFADQTLNSVEMLRAYLMHFGGEKFEFGREYMNVRDASAKNVSDCIASVLENCSIMTQEAICSALLFLPQEAIIDELNKNSRFVFDGSHRFFMIDDVDISEQEIGQISQLIRKMLTLQEFVTTRELITSLQGTYPQLAERFDSFSQIGTRNALAVLLKDQYAFQGNIIARSRITAGDVFRAFAQERERFTLQELLTLQSDIQAPVVYFNAVYKYATRISHDDFIKRELIKFDTEVVDAAIDAWCQGEYIPLPSITNFATFPDVGYAWNVYLLESYVDRYSIGYMLLHNDYTVEKCTGAIVSSGSDKEFEDILADALAKSDLSLNNTTALQYLCDNGYIGAKRYSAIGGVVLKAQTIRNKQHNAG